MSTLPQAPKGSVKNTPIYRTALQLLQFTIKETAHFTKQMRPTLGKMLIEDTVILIGRICKANAAQDKYDHLTEVLNLTEAIEAMWQAAYEVRVINTKALAGSIDLTGSISKQAGGWRKAFSQRRPGSPSVRA